MLQHAAVALQNQFRNVVFDQDQRVRSIRFEVHENRGVSSESLEIRGLLEFEGELDEALTMLRPSYPFQIVQTSSRASRPTVLEVNLSPLVFPPGWEQNGSMPAVFFLEILLVEPRPTIQFPATCDPSIEPPTVREVIFLIHGIRDRAFWQSMVQRVLEEVDGVVVIPIRYGYFDVVRFWLPVITRMPPIHYAQEQIQIAKNRYRIDNYSVIAHSFGTYTISKVLQQTKDLVLNRLVLCGCIVPKDYPWEHLAGRINHEVINDYGTRDIWPVLAHKLSWGYGDTGRFGFGRSDVKDRAHNNAHGDYFKEAFVREYWKPLFESGLVVKSDWEEKAPKTDFLTNTISKAPMKWILTLTGIALAIYLVALFV